MYQVFKSILVDCKIAYKCFIKTSLCLKRTILHCIKLKITALNIIKIVNFCVKNKNNKVVVKLFILLSK